ARLFIVGAFLLALGCNRQGPPSRAPLLLYAEPPAPGQPAYAMSSPGSPGSSPARTEAAMVEPPAVSEPNASNESSSNQGVISSPVGAEPVVPAFGNPGT